MKLFSVTRIGKCKTCGERLKITKAWLSDGWVRWTCVDGHIRERRGWLNG